MTISNHPIIQKINEHRHRFPGSCFLLNWSLLQGRDNQVDFMINQKQKMEQVINQARLDIHSDTIKITVINKTINMLSQDTPNSTVELFLNRLSDLKLAVSANQILMQEAALTIDLINFGDAFIDAIETVDGDNSSKNNRGSNTIIADDYTIEQMITQ